MNKLIASANIGDESVSAVYKDNGDIVLEIVHGEQRRFTPLNLSEITLHPPLVAMLIEVLQKVQKKLPLL